MGFSSLRGLEAAVVTALARGASADAVESILLDAARRVSALPSSVSNDHPPAAAPAAVVVGREELSVLVPPNPDPLTRNAPWEPRRRNARRPLSAAHRPFASTGQLTPSEALAAFKRPQQRPGSAGPSVGLQRRRAGEAAFGGGVEPAVSAAEMVVDLDRLRVRVKNSVVRSITTNSLSIDELLKHKQRQPLQDRSNPSEPFRPARPVKTAFNPGLDLADTAILVRNSQRLRSALRRPH